MREGNWQTSSQNHLRVVNPLVSQTMKRLIVASIVTVICVTNLFAQPRSTSDVKAPSITEKVAGMQRFAGFFPFYWDAKAGKV